MLARTGQDYFDLKCSEGEISCAVKWRGLMARTALSLGRHELMSRFDLTLAG